MKIITYHYIKSFNKKYPYSNFLDKKKFEKQLIFFEKKFGLIKNEDEIFEKNNKILLTFDDGFKDHLFAANILKKMNRTGIFFPTTSVLIKKKFLNVHKSHLILGKIKAEIALKELIIFFKKKDLTYKNERLSNKFKGIYKNYKDSQSKNEFKTIVNYSGNLKIQTLALDHLLKKFNINEKPSDYYLSKKDIIKMSNMNMIIGSHTHTHCLLSKLNYKEQELEIKKSKLILEKIIRKKLNFFCYPHGSKNSYNNNTIKILRKYNFKKSFTVINGNSNYKTFKKKPYELPRYDCNLF
jgi:peptidoglycan/xylan/chitin deacetylase (PgdA/CDA1 family)